jgi:uncharacterized protein YndB with AHSA1/START domain
METDTDRYGQLQQADGRWRLRFVRRLAHPPEKVWRALVEPEHVSAWFPADIVGERAAGAVLQFPFRENEGPTEEGRLLTFDPPALLEFTWAAETLRFELEPDGDGCVLTFLNTFDELGKAARDAAGWHSCLDILAAHLDGTPPPEDVWHEVHPDYAARFGPEASAIGPPEGRFDD